MEGILDDRRAVAKNFKLYLEVDNKSMSQYVMYIYT